MRRLVICSCGFALIALLNGCSRKPASLERRDPSKDPREAATHGDARAQFEFGVRILNSVGNTPDYAEAAEWFRKAAEQGHPGAQAALGFLYHRGHGVPQADVEAYKWLSLAASQDSPEQDAYALWRDYVSRHMTSAQIEEGRKGARESIEPHSR